MTSMNQRVHSLIRLSAIMLLMFTGPAAWAQLDVELEVEPQTLRVGQAARGELRVRGTNISAMPQIPQVDGLQINYTGQTVKMVTVNGESDRFIAFQYSIVPMRPGDYTIGSFEYSVGSSTSYGVAPVQLKVLPASGSSPNGAGDRWGELVFSSMATDDDSVFIGQTIDVDFEIFARSGVNLDRRIQPTELPTAGLAIKELNELQGGRKTMNGVDYTIRRFRITFQGLTEGTFTLAPNIRVNVLVDSGRSSRRSLFDDFFGSMNRYEKHPLTLAPDPIQLTVRPLPTEGRPDNFTGAVGTFRLDVTVTPQQLQAGDPITLRTIISGQGSMDTLTAPEQNLGDDFRVYDPKMVNQEMNRSGTTGRKIFEQVIIPRSATTDTLPPVTFSFFNPKTESYKTLSAGPFSLTIESGSASEVAQVEGGGPEPQQELEVVSSDIAYIKPIGTSWVPLDRALRGDSAVAPWVHGLPPVMLALIALGLRLGILDKKDPKAQRRTQALRTALRKLRSGSQDSTGNTVSLTDLSAIIADYFTDRMGWMPGAFDQERMSDVLTSAERSDDDCHFMQDIIHRADAHRYGGISTTGVEEETLNRVARILEQVEART